MIQRGDGFGFTLEALAELRGGDFDRDVAIQPRVSGAIHLSHAASAEGRKDFVGTESVARRERHLNDAAKFTRSRKIAPGSRRIISRCGPEVSLRVCRC